MQLRRNFNTVLVLMLLVSLALAASVQTVLAAEKVQDQTVKGILEGSKDGLVLRNLMSGSRYRIEGQDLTAMKGKMVEVTGTVTEIPKGSKTIKVTRCTPLKHK